MTTVFMHFKYAHQIGAEEKLWGAQVSIHNEYRKTMGALRGEGNTVSLRKIEKQYTRHLKTAQYFYRGFIERLSARYRLPRLQRIAHAMGSSVQFLDIVDATADKVDTLVCQSCHRALLQLGDLARYRARHGRQRDHGPDAALAYYGLAHELRPSSGVAHHQIAVVLAGEKQDFDIVYHFYRAWAVKEPHPLVARNLASEFQAILASAAQGRTTAGLDPQHMFASWFVRLHARFFKGEPFLQRDELEEEVMHRFETLLRAPEALSMLQKALFVNLSAYHVALGTVHGNATRCSLIQAYKLIPCAESWTEAKALRCEFTLRFAVRSVLAIARDAEKNIGDAVERVRSQHDEQSRDSSYSLDREQYNPLPLLRLAVAWVFACRKELVECQHHLEPYVSAMHRALTRCLSIVMEIDSQLVLHSAAYLLPEDVETIGMVSFEDWSALRLEGNGSWKPRFDEVGVKRDNPVKEDLARIHDIVQAGTQLTNMPSFPWLATDLPKDGTRVTAVVYAEDHQALMATTATDSGNQSVKQDPGELTEDMSRPGSLESTLSPVAPDQPGGVQYHPTPLDSDLNIDSETYSRVETFLAPPEPETTSSNWVRDAGSASYRRAPSTAEEVLGQPQPTSPAAGLSRGKTFPGLPWDFVFTPTPRPSIQQSTRARAGQSHGGQGSGWPTTDRAGALDGLSAQTLQSATRLTPDTACRTLPQTPDAAWAFTNEAAGGSSYHTLTPTAPITREPTSAQAVGPPTTPTRDNRFQSRPDSAGPTTFHSASPPGPRGEAASGPAWGISGFGSTNFSLNPTSSLPQLQSPRGLPDVRHGWPGELPTEGSVPNQGQEGVSAAEHQNIGRARRQATTG